uniref:Dynein regulatory complex protein 12 n=1 Tax=Chromera velia CCMP2878 TaxID=1169474 RepID=A0A0G4HG72_9ALVE|eukprot:Cvel_6680.t1-p1 / transcript=Cvel_6680.t1 / gene=Cvel_6680 / organism=Chromera_velia_CCMP2878 / gene_product=Coiled-coil domain-containing protein 153, putative / transcript_product=Coiled-coil domain-containing protein 153, putative / location=Cvel_scaffold332:49328-52797(-) / protein_length=234 / sequence_SO=supercontig / SO=protein_coding / is_pseudo=false
MPPKKQSGGEDAELEEENIRLTQRVLALQHELMNKREAISRARENTETFRQRLTQRAHDYTNEAERCDREVSEMKKQYVAMRENLEKVIAESEAQVADMKQKIDAKQREIEETRQKKDAEIQLRIDETNRLQAQMEGMAVEFSQMLKDVLDRMSRRVEVTQHVFDLERTSLPMLSRLKDFSLMADDARTSQQQQEPQTERGPGTQAQTLGEGVAAGAAGSSVAPVAALPASGGQ